MEPADFIVEARWIATVDDDDRVLHDHAIAVRDGIIVGIGPREDISADFSATSTRSLPGHLVTPGLINAHTHAPMTLLRGYADDLPLMVWLQEHIWPAEARWVGRDYVRDGAQLAIAEMLLGGTTCFNDMYFHPEIVASVAQTSGIRAVIGMIVLDFPTVWASDPDEYFHKGLQLHDQLRDDPLVSTALAPHAPYTVSDTPLSRVRMYTDELDIPVHMHVHETQHEVDDALAADGARPMRRLQRLGLLNPHLIAVHMTALDDEDLKQAANSGLHVVHCPESNMKLASGACRVAELLDAGINVALGTDGTAANNDLDMIGEMRTAAFLAKHTAGDAAAVPAAQILRMATINGAHALGLGDKTGSLQVGKSADMVAVDLSRPQTQPVYDPVSALVFAASREQVDTVWVAGNCLVDKGELVNFDMPSLLDRIADWGTRVAAAHD